MYHPVIFHAEISAFEVLAHLFHVFPVNFVLTSERERESSAYVIGDVDFDTRNTVPQQHARSVSETVKKTVPVTISSAFLRGDEPRVRQGNL